MAVFSSPRRRFLEGFEQREDGLAYRRTVGARAVRITADEGTWMVQDYDDRRLVFWIALPAAVPLVVLASILSQMAHLSRSTGAAVVWTTFFGFPLLLAIWTAAGRWRLLRGRPHIDGGLPEAEVERRRSGELTWPVLVLTASAAALWCWTVVRSDSTPPAWRMVHGMLGIAVLAVAADEAWGKVRLSRGLGPGEMGR